MTGLLFGDLHSPGQHVPEVVSPTLPADERKRLNAAALRVLAFLQAHGHATNVELCDPAVGGMGGVRRVWDLNQHGYNIRKDHVHGGLWKYTLVTK